MTPIKFSQTFISIVVISLCFVSCSTTVTKTKEPVFNVAIKDVQDDLNKIITCEHINLSGAAIKTDGKLSSKLEISVTNGKNIPADDAQLKALGKLIASDIKKSLKDAKEYDEYTVLFVTVSTDGGITKRHWKGNEFKASEL